MNDEQKPLTINEIKQNIEDIEDDLELYLSLKRINFEKTQPQAFKYKDIVLSNQTGCFDKFTHYTIKDEEYDDIIFSKTESLLVWQKRLIDKLKKLSKIDGKKSDIIKLRDDSGYIAKNGRPMSWQEIGDKVGYSERQCQRIYKELSEQ